MARSRAVKDEFFDSAHLAKVCRDARLLFVGLWLMADHWGVVHNVPTKIKAGVFPFDDEGSSFPVTETQFRQWLADLIDEKFLLRFEYRGRRYLYIRSWEEHQTIQHREKQKHNATIPPEKLKKIVAGLLDENQPPLPNLAPSGKQNGRSIPIESGTNPDRIGNGSGSDTELSQGKLTVREGNLREGGHSPDNSARAPIGEVEKSKAQKAKEQAEKEQEVVYALEKGGSLLKRFKDHMDKHPKAKLLKKVWHNQRFRAPTIRSLALEFMNSEQESDQEAVNDQEPESGTGKDKK